MAVGGVLMTSSRAAASLVVGVLLFGVEFQVSSWVLLGAAFVLTLVALYGLGMLMCSAFMVWGREAWHLENLMQEPVFLLSGFYFPVRRMGSAVAGVGSVIPLTLGLDAMRQLLFSAGAEHGWLPVGVELAILACLGVLYVSVAVWLMMRLERKGREEGRLTIRWH
jgi:ABC-2 type transport system permease protein